MKKYLSIMLLLIAAVFVSCGNDEKDEPTYKNPPKLDTAYFKGKAFQNMDDVNNYKIFTNGQRKIEFTVKESEKKLWLYTDLLFEVKNENDKSYIICTRSDGGQTKPSLVYFDPTNLYQNYEYSQICFDTDLGYAGVEHEKFKYVGTADEILNKYASYTKD